MAIGASWYGMGGWQTSKVLGVDDWAWKKGQTYGTIRVDLEQHCVVDLLTDRSADTRHTWLQAHPGVAIISRDLGGSYAEGARRGAPDAVQVADRWHLLANLRAALERLLTRKHAALPSVPHADDKVQQPAAAPAALDTAVEELTIVEATKDQLLRQQRRARRLSRYDDVTRLHTQGVSVRQIAQQIGMGRQTVRRYLNDWKIAAGSDTIDLSDHYPVKATILYPVASRLHTLYEKLPRDQLPPGRARFSAPGLGRAGRAARVSAQRSTISFAHPPLVFSPAHYN